MSLAARHEAYCVSANKGLDAIAARATNHSNCSGLSIRRGQHRRHQSRSGPHSSKAPSALRARPGICSRPSSRNFAALRSQAVAPTASTKPMTRRASIPGKVLPGEVPLRRCGHRCRSQQPEPLGSKPQTVAVATGSPNGNLARRVAELSPARIGSFVPFTIISGCRKGLI